MPKPKQSIEQQVELLHRSGERLIKALNMPRDKTWWRFMRKEAWIHLKRSLELWWRIRRDYGK